MTDSMKANRASIQISDALQVDGFMLPDGTYRMSQTQAAEAVGKPEINARRFLDSKTIKALMGEGYTPDTVEVDSTDQLRGQSRFNALPLGVVTAYWFHQATQGNKQAFALVWALLTESLERRFDRAFQVTRTEGERNQILSRRVQQLETDLDRLGEGYAVDDLLRQENEFLRRILDRYGIDPWELPGDAEEGAP